MTATMTPPLAAPPQPPTSRRRRAGRSLVALTLVAGIAVVAATLRPDTTMSAHGPEMDPAVRGIYRLPDGELLTMFGSPRMPRYEFDRHVTQLMVDGTDQLVSMSGNQTVKVVRDGAGTVTGLWLQRPDQPSVFAATTAVHTEVEVTIDSDGAALAGTLLVPQGPGPHPAVVFAHGAGPHDRYGTFRLLASHMARRGVAALVYDKRGVGDSTGSYTAATFDDLTADTLAGFDLLTRLPDLDPNRLGVVGFSQSGWTVAEAAQRRDDIAFVIAMSPSGFTPADQQAWLHGNMLAARGFDRSAMVIADRVSRMVYSSLDLVDAGLMPAIPHVPGFWFHALDPYKETTELWREVRQPTLLIWGANDCQVPTHDSMDALGAALDRNPNVTMAVLTGADHGLTLEGPCMMETEGHHDTHNYADGAFTTGPDWINALPQGLNDVPTAPRADTELLGWHLDPPTPAPWYGTLAAQLAAVILLIGLFGISAGRWLVAVARRRATAEPISLRGHLAGVGGLAGLAATMAGVAAFAEIAMLGAVHAAPLVGPPHVNSVSPLTLTTRVLVILTIAVTATLVVPAIRRRDAAAGRTTWPILTGAALLLLWASYWQYLPFA